MEEGWKKAGQQSLNHNTGQVVHCTSATESGEYYLILVIKDSVFIARVFKRWK